MLINLFPFLGAQLVVGIFRDLELEIDRDVIARVKRPDGLGIRVVLVSEHVGLLLFLPKLDHSLFETRIPGVGTVSLSGS